MTYTQEPKIFMSGFANNAGIANDPKIGSQMIPGPEMIPASASDVSVQLRSVQAAGFHKVLHLTELLFQNANKSFCSLEF